MLEWGFCSVSTRQSERISLIKQLAEQFKLSKNKLCRLFGVVRSSFYFDLKEKPIDAEMVRLKALIQQIFNESKGSAGARTISAVVTLQHGIKLTRYKARKLMQDMGLQSRQKKHKYKHRDEKHTVFDNVLDREFYPTAPNQVWTGDVTYVRIKGGFCYLAVVIDLFSRGIVGFKVSDSPDSKLTSDALKMAYATRLQPQDVLFHSDQGTHYTSKKYANALRDCKSMRYSTKGQHYGHSPSSCTRAKQCFAIPSLMG